MARRPRMIAPDFMSDPLDDAVSQDRENIADALMETLDQLGAVDQGTIKGILYRIPVPNGKYEWIRDVFPPFDMSEIMRSLKEDIGGGDFALRIMAEGKVRKTLHFAIMKDKTPLVASKAETGDTMMLFQMMMQQSAEANRQSQAAADRQMQMMMTMTQNSTQMMVGMVSALAGNREKVTDFLPLLMREDKGGGMKEALETLTAAKTLLAGSGEGGGGFDPDDMVGSVLKIAGPVAGAVGRAFANRANGQGADGATGDNPAPVPTALALPHLAAAPITRTEPSRFPILDLIRDDVLFTFGRNHDPQMAAELVFATIDAHNVPEDAIDALVAAFTLSADPLDDLAAEGIDLRSRPEWAAAFLSALVALHAEAGGDAEPGGRDAGREADAGHDGEAGAGRVAVNGGSRPGG